MNSTDPSIIHSVDWHNLSHAYGSAEDLPPHLCNLFRNVDEEEVWEAVYHALHSCACHQGTTYSCTSYVVKCVLFLISEQEVGFGRMADVLCFIAACKYGALNDKDLMREMLSGQKVYESYSDHTDEGVVKWANELIGFCDEYSAS